MVVSWVNINSIEQLGWGVNYIQGFRFWERWFIRV